MSKEKSAFVYNEDYYHLNYQTHSFVKFAYICTIGVLGNINYIDHFLIENLLTKQNHEIEMYLITNSFKCP